MYTEPRQHGCRLAFIEARGHSVLVLENQLLRIAILLSKGADIYEFRYKPTDINLLWQGLNEPYPGGRYVEPVARSQGSFLDYFHGGWQELFPNGGFACTYEGANLGQHGEVSVLPWHAAVVEDTADRVEVRLWVDTVRTPFRIERTLTLKSGIPVLDIKWRVQNRGEQKLHYSWGQHPGFGPPFLSEGSVIDLPGGMICTLAEPAFENYRLAPGQRQPWPVAKGADGKEVRVDQVPAKSVRTHDVIWVSDLPEGWAALRNPALGLGFAMLWDIKTFPYFWHWQVYGGLFGYPAWGEMYHVALEPFTGPFGSLVQNIEAGKAPTLEPGAEHVSWLRAGILAGPAASEPFRGQLPG
jgi:hypothetical protein